MIVDLQFFILAGLAIVVAGALFFAFFYNSLASNKKTNERIKSLRTDPKEKVAAKSSKIDEKQRRKMREDTLKQVDAQREQAMDTSKPPLSVRLDQAGLRISLRTFFIFSSIAGVIVCALMLLLLPVAWYYAIGGGVIAAAGLPRWIINYLRNKRFKKFTLAFPNAIDVIVRGIRSGLPLNDCIRIISKDAEEPVRGEFLKVVEATQVGLTIPEATQRLYKNVPTSETNFFSIVISIQASAGGNLSEALGNLSHVLRERRKMADKIQAVSMEAKASAAIIGSLPFIVAAMVSLASPGYLDPLFQTNTGNKILVICAFAMIFGIGVMKKMINFKF